MTSLAERILALELGEDTRELAVEFLTVVTGIDHTTVNLEEFPDAAEHFPAGIGRVEDGIGVLPVANPLKDEKAIARLERVYLPESAIVNVSVQPYSDCNVTIEQDGHVVIDVTAKTEPFARSAALARAVAIQHVLGED